MINLVLHVKFKKRTVKYLKIDVKVLQEIPERYKEKIKKQVR